MKAIAAQISTKYQVVIPKAVREALDLQPRERLLFLLDGDTVILRPEPDSFTEALRGLHRDLWPDPDEWLEQERSSWEAPWE
jgi:AbrB family looped-hinge helix DNA binding protein